MGRFLHVGSLEDYIKNLDEEDVERFKSLSKKEQLKEMREVDEAIHMTFYASDYVEAIERYGC